MKTRQHHMIRSAPAPQSGDQELSNPIRRRWFALSLSGLLLTSICTLLSSPAQAQCKHWDVSGQWSIREKDGGQLQVNLIQEGANLTGTGRLTNQRGGPDFAGDITGNITGNAFTMKVTLGKFIKRYVGTIGPDGKISGDCHLESASGSEVHWYSYKKMKCADEADQSSSSNTEDQHGKHKKNKKKHHHHDDDQEQSND